MRRTLLCTLAVLLLAAGARGDEDVDESAVVVGKDAEWDSQLKKAKYALVRKKLSLGKH